MADLDRDALLDGYRMVEKNLRADVRRLESERDKAQQQAQFWLNSWQQLLDGLAGLIRAVRARPKGRRFATVLDLQNLVRQQAEDEGGGDRG